MDKEHSRENLQKEEKNIEERTVTEDKTEESSSAEEANGEEITADKPVAREAWNTVYSREKRLEKVERLEKEQRCYALLDELQIPYARVDHEHADTIEACEAVEQVLGEKICKNLFLCNRQKTQFYLLMLEGEKVFKTKDLSKQLGVARLSFADPADMEKYLDITPGSVSVLGLMNDPDNAVQLVIDRPIAESASIGCHPCINSSTLAIATADILEKFLPAVHHPPILVDLPDPE